MSVHTCKTLTDGCYRCDLNRDEIEAAQAEIMAEAHAAWVEYEYGRGPAGSRPRRELRRREFINGYLAANEMPAVES